MTVAKIGSDPTEGGSGTFRISRTGPTTSSLGVTFTLGGSATSGTDYTSIGTGATIASGNTYVDVTVTTLPDNVVENGNESVSILITDGGSTYSAFGSSAFAALAIVDDPPVISVQAGADAIEGGSDGRFVVTRSGGDMTSALTITVAITGTATAGTDYTTISSSVVFAANSDEEIVVVDAISNSTYSPGLTVIATVSSAGTYLAGSPATATVEIHDESPGGFTVGGNTGTISYTTPWSSVDETLSSQNIPVSGFTLTLAGETFDASDCASTPTMRFEYGEYKGLTFSIDTSAISAYPYESISMSGTETVTCVDATTLDNITDTLAGKPDAVVTKTALGPANGSINCTVAWKDCDGAASVTLIARDANGNVVGAAVNGTAKKSDTQTYTLTTNLGNSAVTVTAYIKDANNKIIFTSPGKAGMTK